MEVKAHLFEPIETLSADAKLIRIDPGETKQYDFEIPQDHPAGASYWYHIHMHSSVAVQAWSGMAGSIRVEGPLDDTLARAGVQVDLPFIIWDPHFRELGDAEMRATQGQVTTVARPPSGGSFE